MSYQTNETVLRILKTFFAVPCYTDQTTIFQGVPLIIFWLALDASFLINIKIKIIKSV
jgi:hypothetical protein